MAGYDFDGLVRVGLNNDWRQFMVGSQFDVDEILRYENLHQDLPNVFLTISASSNGELATLKDIRREAKSSLRYSVCYNPEAVELIAESYSEEIDAFRYKFEVIK